MGMPSMWATSSHSFGHWLRRALVCGRRDPIFGFGCLMLETPPLPSREAFTDADVKSLYQNGYWDEEKIVGAYMGGRLVDREAMIEVPWCWEHDAQLVEDLNIGGIFVECWRRVRGDLTGDRICDLGVRAIVDQEGTI